MVESVASLIIVDFIVVIFNFSLSLSLSLSLNLSLCLSLSCGYHWGYTAEVSEQQWDYIWFIEIDIVCYIILWNII